MHPVLYHYNNSITIALPLTIPLYKGITIMTKLFDNIAALSLTQKRELVKSLRFAIKEEVITNKRIKALSIKQKEAEKKLKIQLAIKAAEEKLARLTAKLAS